MTISPPSSHGVAFPDTHWSALSTAREGDSAASRRVIDHLCATYWKPIHTYIRYLGQGDQDAEDLTQEFFRQLMVRGNLFLQARRERGKLRSYVCVAVKRLVIDAARKKERLKRGGGHEIVPLPADGDVPDPRVGDTLSPDKQFDRQWARALVDRTLTELERDYVARGKGELFGGLRQYLGKEREPERQEAVANRLGISVGALRMALSRMRQRFGEIFRREVEATVTSGIPGDVDAEIAYLIGLYE